MTVLFYDGVCGLCDRLVQFVLDRDRAARVTFAPLQGTTAAELLVPRGADPTRLDTLFVLTEDDHLLVRARAVLHVLGLLGWPWRALRAFAILPTPLLDLGYRVVARVRYRLFGRLDACRLPSGDEKVRFLP